MQGLTVNYLNPADLTRLMRKDMEFWGVVVKDKGLKGE